MAKTAIIPACKLDIDVVHTIIGKLGQHILCLLKSRKRHLNIYREANHFLCRFDRTEGFEIQRNIIRCFITLGDFCKGSVFN